MKIRVPPELRSLIEASRQVNERTLNAEIVARLQWSFDAGYDRKAELKEVSDNAIATIQSSPIIRIERQLIAAESKLEDQIDTLRDNVASGHTDHENRIKALETRLDDLNGRLAQYESRAGARSEKN